MYSIVIPLLTALAAGGADLVQWRPNSPAALRLTESDRKQQQVAIHRLLAAEPPRIGQKESWSNPETGRSGTITLVDTSTWQEMPCRRLQFDVRGVNESHEYFFRLCHTPQGEWKMLD